MEEPSVHNLRSEFVRVMEEGGREVVLAKGVTVLSVEPIALGDAGEFRDLQQPLEEAVKARDESRDTDGETRPPTLSTRRASASAAIRSSARSDDTTAQAAARRRRPRQGISSAGASPTAALARGGEAVSRQRHARLLHLDQGVLEGFRARFLVSNDYIYGHPAIPRSRRRSTAPSSRKERNPKRIVQTPSPKTTLSNAKCLATLHAAQKDASQKKDRKSQERRSEESRNRSAEHPATSGPPARRGAVSVSHRHLGKARPGTPGRGHLVWQHPAVRGSDPGKVGLHQPPLLLAGGVTTWADSVACQGNPKQKDIDVILDRRNILKAFQEKDVPVWPRDPAECRATNAGIGGPELRG